MPDPKTTVILLLLLVGVFTFLTEVSKPSRHICTVTEEAVLTRDTCGVS